MSAIKHWDVLSTVWPSRRRVFSRLTKGLLRSTQAIYGLVRAAAGIVPSSDFAPRLGADGLVNLAASDSRSLSQPEVILPPCDGVIFGRVSVGDFTMIGEFALTTGR